MTPVLLFFFKIALAIGVFCGLHTNFRIICFISLKNAIGILKGIALDLVNIALGNTF